MAIISKEEIKVDVTFTGEEGYEDAADAQDDLRKSTAKLDKELDGLRGSGEAATESMGKMDKATSAAANGLRTLGGAAAAYVSIEGAKMAWTIAHQGTQLLDLEANAKRAGVQLGALRKASAGVIADTELQKAAIFGKTMADGMGLGRKATEQLTESAIALGTAFGRDLNDSVKEVIKSLDGETGALQDLFGMTIKSEETFKAYAETLGITIGDLTIAQKRTAMLAEIQEKLNESIANAPTGDYALAMDRATVAMDNLVASGKRWIGLNLVMPVVGDSTVLSLVKARREAILDPGKQARVEAAAAAKDKALMDKAAADAAATLEAKKAKESAKRAAAFASQRSAFDAKMRQRELVLVEAGYDRELAALEMKHADELAEAEKYNYDLEELARIHNEEMHQLDLKELDRQGKFYEAEAKLAEAAAKESAKIAGMRASLINDESERELALLKLKYDEEMRMAKGNADAQKLLTKQYQRDIADIQVDGIKDATERSVAAIKLSLKRQIEALGVGPSAGAPPKDPAAVLKSELRNEVDRLDKARDMMVATAKGGVEAARRVEKLLTPDDASPEFLEARRAAEEIRSLRAAPGANIVGSVKDAQGRMLLEAELAYERASFAAGVPLGENPPDGGARRLLAQSYRANNVPGINSDPQNYGYMDAYEAENIALPYAKNTAMLVGLGKLLREASPEQLAKMWNSDSGSGQTDFTEDDALFAALGTPEMEKYEQLLDDMEIMRQEREAESAEEAQATALENERVIAAERFLLKQGEYQELLDAEAAHQEKIASLTEKAMNKIAAIEARAMSDRINLYTNTTGKVASAVEETAAAMGKMGLAQEKVEAVSMFVRGVKSAADAVSFTGEAVAAIAAGNPFSATAYFSAASAKTIASVAYFKGAAESGFGGGGKSKPTGAGAGQYTRPGAFDLTGSGSDESKTEVVLSFTKPDEDDFFSSFARNLNANQRSDTATPIDNNRPLEI